MLAATADRAVTPTQEQREMILFEVFKADSHRQKSLTETRLRSERQCVRAPASCLYPRGGAGARDAFTHADVHWLVL